jgi:hypothetical protein
MAESNLILPQALFKFGQNLARWPFLIARIMIVAIQATHLGRLPVRPARSFRGRLLDKIGDARFFRGAETAKPKPRTERRAELQLLSDRGAPINLNNF